MARCTVPGAICREAQHRSTDINCVGTISCRDVASVWVKRTPMGCRCEATGLEPSCSTQPQMSPWNPTATALTGCPSLLLYRHWLHRIWVFNDFVSTPNSHEPILVAIWYNESILGLELHLGWCLGYKKWHSARFLSPDNSDLVSTSVIPKQLFIHTLVFSLDRFWPWHLH